MNSLLMFFLLLMLSSNTYVSYITFLLCMIHMVLSMFLLGNYYLSLMYLMMYMGSMAMLFMYMLMVLSMMSSYRYGYLLFLLPFTTLSLLGISINYSNSMLSTVLTYSYSIYTSLIMPMALILFMAMMFAISSI